MAGKLWKFECPRCSTTNTYQDRSCENCGGPLRANLQKGADRRVTSVSLDCERCGRDNLTAKSCHSCGAHAGDTIQVQSMFGGWSRAKR